jgi:hypothetical protein
MQQPLGFKGLICLKTQSIGRERCWNICCHYWTLQEFSAGNRHLFYGIFGTGDWGRGGIFEWGYRAEAGRNCLFSGARFHLSSCKVVKVCVWLRNVLHSFLRFPTTCYASLLHFRQHGTAWDVLGAFAILRKATVTFLIYVCPSVRLSVCPFMSVYVWALFRKSVEKIQVLLKSDKNSRYFKWRSLYVYG